MAPAVNNLGSVYFQRGEVNAALECAQRALRIWTKFLGVEHPDTVLAQRNVDAVLSAMRR